MSTDWRQQVDSILEQLLNIHEKLREGLEGCSEEDLEKLEQTRGIRLPATLAQLLRRIGRSRGQLFAGADFSFPEILEYQEIAESLLGEKKDLSLGEQDFVFWMERGYQFYFLKTGEDDNSAVFFYNDDDSEFVEVADAFTKWLEVCIQEEIKLRGSSSGD